MTIIDNVPKPEKPKTPLLVWQEPLRAHLVHEPVQVRQIESEGSYSFAQIIDRGKQLLEETLTEGNLARELYNPLVYFRRLQPDAGVREVTIDFLMRIGAMGKFRPQPLMYENLIKDLSGMLLNQMQPPPVPWRIAPKEIVSPEPENEKKPTHEERVQLLVENASTVLDNAFLHNTVYQDATTTALARLIVNFRDQSNGTLGGRSNYEIAQIFLNLVNQPRGAKRPGYFSQRTLGTVVQNIMIKLTDPLFTF